MNFSDYLDAFKQGPQWASMQATVEDSPWHREANVAVHTEMCLERYGDLFSAQRTERQNAISRLALLFHDTGKPAAEETLEKKDGTGPYRRYAGHEQQSAVTFMETYLADSRLRALLGQYGPRDGVEVARQIRWIIEHHLPYGLKDQQKVSGLRTATALTLGTDYTCFYDCLRSDAAGRISDDHAEKLQKVEDWIKEFDVAPVHAIQPRHANARKAYLLIGASGSGKSTFAGEGRKLSLDALRLAFAHDLTEGMDPKEAYATAWRHCTEHDAAFRQYQQGMVKKIAAQAYAEGSDLFIDNVNATRKSRAQWVQIVGAIGFDVVAVEFWVPRQVVLDRQQTRPDKQVPPAAVSAQHASITSAWLGHECSAVQVVTWP